MSDPNEVKACAACGFLMPAAAVFCPECGHDHRGRDAGPPVVLDSGDDRIGTVVAHRYTIMERLAKGGMGEIYLARHHEFDQKVAVKVLSRAYAADEQLAVRFFNEARSATRINHPYAVSVYDFGRLDDGTLYILMEYIQGRSLAKVLKRNGPLHPAIALRITAQLCEVLGCAHRERIIHRDIKPDNIMVIEGAGGRISIKVLDFGIAKILDDELGGDLTQTGMTFGTPEYMSPEQAAGDPLDHRTDIYSLGVLLFTMIKGHPPFQGKNKLSLLQRHLNEQPPEVSDGIAGAVPRDLTRFIARLLEKEPGDRPQSMAEVLRETERLAAIVGSPPDPGRRSAREILSSARAVLKDQEVDSPPPAAGLGAMKGIDATMLDPGPLPAPAPGASEEPAEEGGDSGAWAIGDAGSDADDGFSATGISPAVGPDEEAFSLGDDAPESVSTGFGSAALDFGAPPPGVRRRAVRRGGSPVARAMIALLSAAVVFAAILGAGYWWQQGGAPSEPSPPASAVAPDGDAPAQETAAELAPEATPEAEGPAPWEREVREAWGHFQDGQVERADAELARIRSAWPEADSREMRRLDERMEELRQLTAEVEGLLAEGECLRADEAVIRIRDSFSRRYASRYYGQLTACREEAARRRAAQRARPAEASPSGAASSPPPREPAPAREAAPAPPPAEAPPRPRAPSPVLPPAEL